VKAKQSQPDLVAIAFHESAHAVVCYRLRPETPSNGISIIPRGSTLGHAGSEGFASIFQGKRADGQNVEMPILSDVDAEIQESFAGYYASLLAGEPRNAARIGASGDLDMVDTLLRYTNTARAVLRKRAERIVQREWKAISAVALEVLKHRSLDQTEVELIVDMADGEAPPDALKRYRYLKASAQRE
jgi:hypothetical protein